ncbi:MAG: SoxY-related AACIE arm protein [Proteobacteria bacterium]|nr:SoxY-related AACIE arm protein [Pseudomonadota bacterium]
MKRPRNLRAFLASAAGLAAAACLPAGVHAQATVNMLRGTEKDMLAAIARVTGSKPAQKGRVKLEVPPLVDNGNAVAISVAVDSPMTEANHVKEIHIFSERNPEPVILSMKLGPRAGRAAAATRVRLADTQTLVAIAAMSDGTFWSGSAQTVVTIAACLEDL